MAPNAGASTSCDSTWRMSLVLGFTTLMSSKICDEFTVGGRKVCAPALFVPGVGKCGTNALKAYTGTHPRLRWANKSEVPFDPDDVSPEELIGDNNPGVTADDNLLWAIKAPAMGIKVHARLLADTESACA